MKKFLLGLAVAALLLVVLPKPAYAAPDCSTKEIGASGVPDDFVSGRKSSFTISLSNLQPNTSYTIHLDGPIGGDYKETKNSNDSGSLSLTFNSSKHKYGFQRMPTEVGKGKRRLYIDQVGPAYCFIGDYHIRRVATLPDSCDLSVTPACIDRNTPGALISKNVILNNTAFNGTGLLLINKGVVPITGTTISIANGSFSYDLGVLTPNTYTIELKNFMTGALICSEVLTVKEACQSGDQSITGEGLTIRPQECTTNIVSKPGDYESDPIKAPGIKTALGCIPYELVPLIAWIFGLAVSVGGGIAFLIMGIGAFLFITSQGNPEQIQKAKEMMVSAGTGLLFIIFSVFLLRLIGVDILRIPGFT